jgi:hypothetical protein
VARRPAAAGLSGRLLAGASPALRAAAGAQIRTAPVWRPPDQLDELVDEQRFSAALIGLDPAKVAASVAELDVYYTDARHRARAVAEAKKSLLMSFNPPVSGALAHGLAGAIRAGSATTR